LIQRVVERAGEQPAAGRPTLTTDTGRGAGGFSGTAPTPVTFGQTYVDGVLGAQIPGLDDVLAGP
jgi:hypothetical protein